MSMTDYSFLRFTNEIGSGLEYSPDVQWGYFSPIQLLPSELYCQITNVAGGVGFGGTYAAKIVNYLGEELADVTNRVFAVDFVSEIDGNTQTKIELVSLGVDFGTMPVFLAMEMVGSGIIWYSNPFLLTDVNAHLTTRFDYTDNGKVFGIDYPTAQVIQSVNLRCTFQNNSIESKQSDYTTLSGKRLSSRVIQTESALFLFDQIDNFTYRRLMKVLSHDVIYIGGYKATAKVTTALEDRYSRQVNIHPYKFTVPIDYNDNFLPYYQIYDPLRIIAYSPFIGQVTSDAAQWPFDPYLTLNTAPTLQATGQMIGLYDYATDMLIYQMADTDILISGSDAVFPNFFTNAGTLAIGRYYITVPSGVLVDNIGNTVEVLSKQWYFDVVANKYDTGFYNRHKYA